MYSVGSKVVYPFHGAGTIVSISTKSIGERSRVYYVIDTLAQRSMKLMIPVRRAEEAGLRRAGRPTDLFKVLAWLCVAPMEEKIERDYRTRKSLMDERLKSGCFQEVATAVRNLFYMHSQRPLGMTDRQFLDSGKEFLAGELAVALGVDISEAMQRLEDRLAQMLPVEAS